MQKEKTEIKTGHGAPVDNRAASLTVGPRGPILLQDITFLDELAHFDRERIPERVVHAKGAGMYKVVSNQKVFNVIKSRYLTHLIIFELLQFFYFPPSSHL